MDLIETDADTNPCWVVGRRTKGIEPPTRDLDLEAGGAATRSRRACGHPHLDGQGPRAGAARAPVDGFGAAVAAYAVQFVQRDAVRGGIRHRVLVHELEGGGVLRVVAD